MPFATSNKTIGKPFTEFDVIDSTNNYAMARAKSGLATHGAAWFAHYQTHGKGQRGKRWTANAGENIMLSVLLNALGLSASRQFPLMATISLAAHDFFSALAGPETKIKWPNDIYWNDRKAGGILVENVIRGQIWQWAVAGFGINVNQRSFDAASANAVSLYQITRKQYDPVLLAKDLCASLDKRYQQLRVENYGSILEEYNAVLYKRQQTVRLKHENEVFACTISGVNEAGQLEVINASTQQRFDFGEVEWNW